MSAGPASYGLVVGDLELALRKVAVDGQSTASDLVLIDAEVANLESRVATLEARPPGIGDAPSNGFAYLRSDGGWESGGTLSGSLLLAHDPSAVNEAATKAYVDSHAGGGGTVISVTAGTGLTGGAITVSGTIALSTPVALANGGTAATTAAAALTSLGAYPAANPANYVNASGAAAAAPVQSVATRTGAVTLTHTDITDWSAATAGFAPPSPYVSNPAMDGTAAPGFSALYARGDHVHPTDTSRAPLASPAFTGAPNLPTGSIAVTQTAGDNSTALATTAFVTASFLTAATAAATYAPLVSPLFTGTPNLPTGTVGVTQTYADASTKLATTAFVRNQIISRAAVQTPNLNPTGTTGSVMAGLAGSITPQISGRLLVIAVGSTSWTVAGVVTVQLRYGTGTAPANGAALAGAAVGNTGQIFVEAADWQIPWSCFAVITGLTVGTPYWLDVSQVASYGANVALLAAMVTAIEL